MAALGLIFIQNGYGKYCIDFEVNDISVLDHPIPKMREVPREALVAHLSDADRALLSDMFIENRKDLEEKLAQADAKGLPKILVLTEPLTKSLATREQLFRDLIREYGIIDGKPGVIVIKPHPRDLLDYHKAFPGDVVLDSHFPMEILNFTGASFDRVVTVYTVPSSIHCAREKVYLGSSFMDRYESPEDHRSVTNAAASVTRS